MGSSRLKDDYLIENLLHRSNNRLVSIHDFDRYDRAIFLTHYKGVYKGSPIHNLKKTFWQLPSTYLPTVEHKAGRNVASGFYRQSGSDP